MNRRDALRAVGAAAVVPSVLCEAAYAFQVPKDLVSLGECEVESAFIPTRITAAELAARTAEFERGLREIYPNLSKMRSTVKADDDVDLDVTAYYSTTCDGIGLTLGVYGVSVVSYKDGEPIDVKCWVCDA